MISVIVPVYKVEPYLHQCVDSILAQTYRDIEVLLIDDGSPDRCGEICDEYAEKDDRVRVFHTENRGLSAARNLGISEAKGNYIGFVDSDDWIESDMYEVLLRRMQETGADIGVCGYLQEGTNTSTTDMFESETYKGIDALQALIAGGINNQVWNKLYQSGLLQKNPFQEGKGYEDIAVMHEIISDTSCITVIKSQKYHYRIRTYSITKTITTENLIDYTDACSSRYCFFRDKYPDLFQKNESNLLIWYAEGIARLWRWWYGRSDEDKQINKAKIDEMRRFTTNNLSPLMRGILPNYLRVSIVFMKHSSNVSFALLYFMNQLYRSIRFNKSSQIITSEYRL